MTPVARPDEGLNAAVAAELRAERAAKDLTTKELSALAGIPYASLRRYLGAERHIDVATVAALCGALGLEAGELVARASDRLERARRSDGDDVPTLGQRRRQRSYPILDDEAARDPHAVTDDE
ncbi:MAG: helix-turn-helix domain-containing protein [Nocardioides sp.]|uniref:helix-turn-helix domain-containing protein n=1 Tax=Nocardioides sp. TaxID=35761 RepID=UPI003F11C410